MSKPVQTTYGTHYLVVTEEKNVDTLTFEKAKPELIQLASNIYKNTQTLRDGRIMPKSSAETTRDSVEKYRKAGLIQAKIWVHPAEALKVRLYAAKQLLTKPILDYLRRS